MTYPTSKVLMRCKTLLTLAFAVTSMQSIGQASIPGYTLSNFVNNVVQRPQSHIQADASFITNNPDLNTSWWNLGDISSPPYILLLTWDNPIFNGAGNDIMIVCLNSTLSGRADVRLLLTDGTYTNVQNLDFTKQMLSSPKAVTVRAYQTGEATITNGGSWRPAGKPVDIASFYTGPLAVKGIEFNNYVTQNLDLIAVASTQNAVFPITLTSFTGNVVKNTPTLYWQTALEINASHFEIERSTDGVLFTKIGTMKTAAGNHQNTSYQYTDNTAFNSNYYYRLKMVDLDGTFKLSGVVYTKCAAENVLDVIVKQSLSANHLTLISVQTGLQYQLINASGATVAKGIITGAETNIPTDTFSNGIYFIQFGNGKKTVKIVIAH